MEQCPNCNSKSGVDVHGRQFCHACKKDFGARSIIKIERPTTRLELPKPNDESLPIEAYEYLDKYLDGPDIPTNIFWSKEYQRLCFPIYQTYQFAPEEEMTGCWMRDVYGNSDRKWLYAGADKNSYCWLIETKTIESDYDCVYPRVCLVEDVLSAIKVSKIMDAICLGGTTINMYTQEVIKDYKNVFVFLDSDKAGKEGAIKIRNKLKLLHDVKLVRANKDPKEYSYAELEALLK